MISKHNTDFLYIIELLPWILKIKSLLCFERHNLVSFFALYNFIFYDVVNYLILIFLVVH